MNAVCCCCCCLCERKLCVFSLYRQTPARGTTVVVRGKTGTSRAADDFRHGTCCGRAESSRTLRLRLRWFCTYLGWLKFYVPWAREEGTMRKTSAFLWWDLSGLYFLLALKMQTSNWHLKWHRLGPRWEAPRSMSQLKNRKHHGWLVRWFDLTATWKCWTASNWSLAWVEKVNAFLLFLVSYKNKLEWLNPGMLETITNACRNNRVYSIHFLFQ